VSYPELKSKEVVVVVVVVVLVVVVSMLRHGGGRVLKAMSSVESMSSNTLVGTVRSLSVYTTAPPIPPKSKCKSKSQSKCKFKSKSQSQCQPQSSQSCVSGSRRTIITSTTGLARQHRCSNNSTLLPRRWKSNNLHKRAAQALGKNRNNKIDSKIDANDDDESSISSSPSNKSYNSNAAAGSISTTQSVFSEMMKNASSAMSDTQDHNNNNDNDSDNQNHNQNQNDNHNQNQKSNDAQQQQQQQADAMEAGSTTETNSAPKSPPSIPNMQGHLHEFAPKIVVVGVGGGGGNAVNNMIANQLHGVDFLTLNTDAQHLSTTLTENRIQIGSTLTSGLGCGANPDAGRLAAEESREQITELLSDAHMVFITAGMGGGTGTGAAPVVAEVCYNLGILTVGVVTKPFRFEGTQRMRLANEGVTRLREVVDTLIVIPNQNLFHLANDQTSFVDSFAMADNVLLAGVKSITDLMTTPGLINLDFADVQSVMSGMGNAILGTGQSSFEDIKDGKKQLERAVVAAELALANPLLGSNMDIGTAKGMLVNITGGKDMTLFEVDRAAQLITERVEDDHANIIFGSAYDESLEGSVRVSVVATGIEEYKEEKKV